MTISCNSQKQNPVAIPVESMSIDREIHIESIDTVYIELPRQTTERTTGDSVSHLETEYATSHARINPDGTLTHTLETLSTPIAVPVKTYSDTIKSIAKVEVPVAVEIPVEVDRRLSKWERIKQETGGLALGIIILTIILLTIKFLRKLRACTFHTPNNH